MEEKNPQIDNLLERINSLNNVFEQAEKVCANEIVEFIEEKQHEVTLYTEDIQQSKVIQLEIMVDDFKFIRETLKETVENGRKIIHILTLESLDSDETNRASLITSFAELISSVNNSVKLMSQSYKDIASVMESLEKIRKSKDVKNQKENNNVYIDKMLVQNETTPISTTDIIARLANKNEEN